MPVYTGGKQFTGQNLGTVTAGSSGDISGESIGNVADATTTTLTTGSAPVLPGSVTAYADGNTVSSVSGVTATVLDHIAGEIEVQNSSGGSVAITVDYSYGVELTTETPHISAVTTYSDGTDVSSVTGVKSGVASPTAGSIVVYNTTGADVVITADYVLDTASFTNTAELSVSTSPVAAVTSGTSPNEMLVWTDPTADRYDALSHHPITAYTNQSSYSLLGPDPAILTPNYSEYSNSSERSVDMEPASKALGGHSLAAMDVWNLTQQEKWDYFSTIPYVQYTDKSSYGIFDTGAVHTPQYSSYSNESEVSLNDSVPGTSEYGKGGTEMGLWAASTHDRYNFLSGVPVVQYRPNNQSSYQIFSDPAVLTPNYSTFQNKSNIDLSDVVPAGAERGPNVEGSVSFNIGVYLAEDPDNPGESRLVEVENADVVVQSADGFQEATQTGQDGTTTGSVPTQSRSFAVLVAHPQVGEKTVEYTLDVGVWELTDAIYLPFPSGGSSGMMAGNGVNMG